MNESTRPKIIVAMPAYNEEKYIGSIVLEAPQYAGEFVVVDDGSTDRTSKVTKFAGATVTHHGENKGYGAAIQSILAQAKKRNSDIRVIRDLE